MESPKWLRAHLGNSCAQLFNRLFKGFRNQRVSGHWAILSLKWDDHGPEGVKNRNCDLNCALIGAVISWTKMSPSPIGQMA